MSNVAVGGAGTIAPGALTTGQLASLPSTATQFPGLANVAVPDITSATNIPIESALQSYQAPGINATQYAELQQAKALLNPAALTTPPVVPPVTPTVTPTWAGSPLNPANMGANPASCAWDWSITTGF